MKTEEIRRIEDLLAAAAYGELDSWAASVDLSDLAQAWSRFKPLTRLALFKLMDPPRALEFYSGLTFNEKYFLLCGFPPASIAPILEKLSAGQKTLFHQMPREYYDRMFRQLLAEKVEVSIPISGD